MWDLELDPSGNLRRAFVAVTLQPFWIWFVCGTQSGENDSKMEKAWECLQLVSIGIHPSSLISITLHTLVLGVARNLPLDSGWSLRQWGHFRRMHNVIFFLYNVISKKAISTKTSRLGILLPYRSYTLLWDSTPRIRMSDPAESIEDQVSDFLVDYRPSVTGFSPSKQA